MDICKRSVTLFSLLTTAVMFLLHAQTSASAIVNGLQICCKSILPSLFPFFVVTNLWISLGYGEQLSCAAAPIMTRMFHLPGAAASALVLSCCGGYPVGAQTIVSLYGTKQISKNDAEQALLFCNNAGPAFVFGILGGTLFHSILLGAALFLIHLISALLIGFLFRPPSLQDSLMSEKVASNTPPLLPSLTSAIKKAGEVTLNICIFVLFFSVLSSHIEQIVPTQWKQSPLFSLILGSLELAGGISRLAEIPLSSSFKFVFSSALLGWGGLCIHCQTLSVLSNSGLSAKSYLIGKSLHAVVSAAFACLITPFLPLDTVCFSEGYRTIPLWISLLMLLAVFPKSSSRKHAKNRI